jgi:hypothetical protein
VSTDGSNHRTEAMKDTSTAALLGVAIGYLLHAHWPVLESFIRTLIL